MAVEGVKGEMVRATNVAQAQATANGNLADAIWALVRYENCGVLYINTAATYSIPSLRQNQQYSGAYGYEPQQSGAFGFGDGLPSDAQMAERQRRLRE